VALVHQLGATTHLASCTSTECGNGLNPPTAGTHCGATVACRVHTEPQSRCEWIHNLEHGHAVLAYNCPDGCPDVVTDLEALRSENGPTRILITPDPSLPTRVAAIVWGWSHSAETVDRRSFECLLAKQDLEAPEAGLACAQ
jgi:hypothetical protein